MKQQNVFVTWVVAEAIRKQGGHGKKTGLPFFVMSLFVTHMSTFITSDGTVVTFNEIPKRMGYPCGVIRERGVGTWMWSVKS